LLLKQHFYFFSLCNTYAIHRQALLRGFQVEKEKHLLRRGGYTFPQYCTKKHDEFFRVLNRATTLEADESYDTEIFSKWRQNHDIPCDQYQRPNNVMPRRLRKSLKTLGRTNVLGGHNCFFVTTMSLAPNGTRKNDVVVILQGCEMPVALRSRGRYWVLVGACYVVGFMHRQFVKYRRRCEIEEEVFGIE
jgi:hypothetical protein